jgi:hypothetical protein
VPGYFLETSALAKLYHWEVGSERMEALIEAPEARLIISQLVEIESVFATKVRMGVIDKTALEQLRGRFYADLARGQFEVVVSFVGQPLRLPCNALLPSAPASSSTISIAWNSSAAISSSDSLTPSFQRRPQIERPA